MLINKYIDLFAPRPINARCSQFILTREKTGHTVAAAIAGTLFILAAAATAVALTVLALPVILYASVPIGAVALILSILSFAAIARINTIYANKMGNPVPNAQRDFSKASQLSDQRELDDLKCHYELLREYSKKDINPAYQELLIKKINSSLATLKPNPDLYAYAKVIANRCGYEVK